jgi:hypothetical protein
LSRIPPGWVLVVLLALVAANLFYAIFPYRRRWYLATLVSTALGVGLGQGWDLAGLPSLRFGEANLLPALLFAVALQPLVSRLPRRSGQ